MYTSSHRIKAGEALPSRNPTKIIGDTQAETNLRHVNSLWFIIADFGGSVNHCTEL